MPMIAAVQSLNRQFHPDNIETFAHNVDAFGPGKPLDAGTFLNPGSLKNNAQAYINKMPAAIAETIRGVIHVALSASPPTPVVLNWTPGYDFKVVVSHAPCSITVTLEGPHPAALGVPSGLEAS